MASFSADSFSVDAFDPNAFDLDFLQELLGGGSAGGGRGGRGGRSLRHYSGHSVPFYPGKKQKEIDRELKRLEAQRRRVELEEQDAIAKQQYSSSAGYLELMRRTAAKQVELALELAELERRKREVEQRELDEAIAAYEKYKEWKARH